MFWVVLCFVGWFCVVWDFFVLCNSAAVCCVFVCVGLRWFVLACFRLFAWFCVALFCNALFVLVCLSLLWCVMF